MRSATLLPKLSPRGGEPLFLGGLKASGKRGGRGCEGRIKTDLWGAVGCDRPVWGCRSVRLLPPSARPCVPAPPPALREERARTETRPVPRLVPCFPRSSRIHTGRLELESLLHLPGMAGARLQRGKHRPSPREQAVWLSCSLRQGESQQRAEPGSWGAAGLRSRGKW